MEQIVEELWAGKKGAATRFYRLYSERIKKYLYSKLPGREEVEEITQDVFVSALNSISLYRGESSLMTWLISIARHEVADYYRKRYVRQAVEKTAPLFEQIVGEMNSPEFLLKKKKMRARFMSAFNSLSASHRDVLSYRYELGMSVVEVSRRMSMSFKATESMLYRARQAFALAYRQGQEGA